MSRLIIVSNRLPFSLEKKGKELSLRPSSGGLVSAIISYFDKESTADEVFTEKIWVGSVDFSPHEYQQVKDTVPSAPFTIEAIFPDKDIYSRYYDGFSNSTLWPLFHYFPSLVEYKKDCFEAYQQVNELFAEKLAGIIQKDDVIWIHDYQLMLLPQKLRRKFPAASIGFFLHTPFPSYELIRLLPKPWRVALLEGMLGADLIGFHTHDYVQHFIQTARMIMKLDNNFNSLQYRNRLVKADLFPIGIDYEKFNQSDKNPAVINAKQAFLQSFEDKKIIFSVDRQDYSKGLMYRLNGYEQFLKMYPEWKEKVVFILNVIPSRNSIPTYIKRKKALEEKVSTINGSLSSIHWQPIVYRYNHLPFEELVALYQLADVALITPLRDGMNLVAKEYVASNTTKEGMLVLSELAGAASELNEAILVNPTDQEEVANSIQQALVMSPMEKKQRMSLMQDRIRAYDVVKWVSDFIEQLKSIKAEQEKLSVRILNERSVMEIVSVFEKSSKRLFLLDYDGTLSPFAKLPAEAVPSDKLKRLITQLVADKRNECVIISGRDQYTLEKWFRHLPVTLVAEHGAAIRHKDGEWDLQTSAGDAWKEQIRTVMQLFVSRCSGSFVEEKNNTLVWHYRNTYADLGFTRSRELLNTLTQLTANAPLQVIDGNKVLEVRQMGVDKGVVTLKLIQHFQPDFTICMGDDTTDEDMFRALENKAFTIKIGGRVSAAQFNLLTQEEVVPFLQMFVTETTGADPKPFRKNFETPYNV
jgi:trehalose 6-phosphate synthase/phosphatase